MVRLNDLVIGAGLSIEIVDAKESIPSEIELFCDPSTLEDCSSKVSFNSPLMRFDIFLFIMQLFDFKCL